MPEEARYRFFYRGKRYLIPKDYIDKEHPGGGDKVMPYVGRDMTDAFEDADHSIDAVELLEGWLEEECALRVSSDPAVVASPAQEEVEKTAELATELSPLVAAFISSAPALAPTVSTAPMTAVPAGASRAKREPLMPAVVTAASVAAVMASIALAVAWITKRQRS
ncbi:hypothetical protein LSCM1_01414 [Leishmania martiniquensis]|uniref:Cytochrome b5 heme-binding domain-containing protein n=1 Tax=Leishmania martiniquensis TaxID=1580590 RepID=A0A836KCI5_9TRYP|nr:hypothetical protein LSCM1_01414 [Leishmania martiniquensis]